MKRQFLLKLYIYFWYVPLVAFLVGIKICLLSFLVTSIQSREQDSLKLLPKSFSQQGSFHKIRNEKVSPIAINFSPADVKSQISSHRRRRRRLSGQQRNVDDEKAKKLDDNVAPKIREDWRILSNLQHSEIRASHENRTEAESIWLIFNRIPRCGGGTLVKLLQTLAERNGFSHQEHEYQTPWPRFLVEQEQQSLVTWFEYQHLPKSYDRHFYFVNFTKYQKYVKDKPIYINMIRDPVERLRSDYLAKRSNKVLSKMEIQRRDNQSLGSGMKWFNLDFEECVFTQNEECKFETGSQNFRLAIPFFCGQHNSCVIINDKWGLQMAKFTIERYYSVVGVLERMDQTFTVLENYVPKFFSGVSEFYEELDMDDKFSGKSKISKNGGDMNNSSIKVRGSAARKILEEKLHAEVDLYRFVVRRLALQYAHLQGTY